MTYPSALHWLRGLPAGTAPEGVIPHPFADGEHAAPSAHPAGEAPSDVPILRLVEDTPEDRDEVADPDPESAPLWAEYALTRSRPSRDRLILHYAPVVARVAARVGMRLPRAVEHADLVSYGMFGLIDAIEKYDTDREVRFESYAVTRIRGAIMDELRAGDWVPRSVRTKARAVDKAHAELEARLHRAPTDEETAAHLHMSVRELRAVYAKLATVNVAALDELTGARGIPFKDTLRDERCTDPAGAIDAAETKHLLARAIEQLGERERIVVVLYYYEGMTLAEIGRVLGVTESRISQMHTGAMLRLRTRLVEAERG
ncbi:FliA/WhiG family RNA polymerase sigma factor [Cellulomonas sp.]|uniref:FliA/WhiG family RNA polymerase sigma factor n=1 Tax=Cellulomonas sp. TaxID=40001 RepID=UPI001B155AC2|nr:FliA/WhiG family RNA polymerase sigma factor [Cellulomonas sp.]MBO9556004.1 FliA/WhiG family RNA polymerase sigma factor [Cellulomonas sp.]